MFFVFFDPLMELCDNNTKGIFINKVRDLNNIFE